MLGARERSSRPSWLTKWGCLGSSCCGRSPERSGSAAAGAALLVKLCGSRQCHCPHACHELPCVGGDRGTGRERPFTKRRWGVCSGAEPCGGSSKPG